MASLSPLLYLVTLNYVSWIVTARRIETVSPFSANPRGGATRQRHDSTTKSKFPCNDVDRWVAASPTALAAVCRDGIAFVAVQNSPVREPLLLPAGTQSNTQLSNNTQSNETAPSLLLPSSFGGPFRIEKIDEGTMCLVTAGWRTDCVEMVETCRQIVADERDRYGTVDGFGPALAREASYWLARSAFSDSTRTRSCVGLLASCGAPRPKHVEVDANEDGNGDYDGCLYLVDAAGATRVRALAIGSDADAASSELSSRLTQKKFQYLTKEEGVAILMDILAKVARAKGGANDLDETMSSDIVEHGISGWVEAAVIDFETRSMQRFWRNDDYRLCGTSKP